MIFSGVAAKNIRLRDFHTFDCPFYVLESCLQTNPKGVPKWDPRARLGIYLGRSPAHAGNVALVLNPSTGLVSPKYHVVFDDDFTTAPHLIKGTVPSNWEKLVLGSRERSTDELFYLTQTWMQPTSDKSAYEILETLSNVNEGDEAIPNVTKDSEGGTSSLRVRFSEGDHLSTNAQVSEGDSNDNDLVMPTMVNLESSGL